MRRRRPQAVRRDHLHIYDLHGICEACGRHEERGYTKLEIGMFIFIAVFMSWTVFMILFISHRPGS